MPSADDFTNELFRMMHEAERAGQDSLEVEAGELHRRVGGYPGRDHRMPLCCEAMRAQVHKGYGDTLVSAPPSGYGASLRIRYRLPRGEFVGL